VPTCEQIKHKKYEPSTEHGVTVASRIISFQAIIKGITTSSQFRNKFGIDEGLQ